MARIGFVFSLFTLLLPAQSHDASPFSGTWKMDASRSESAHQAVPIGPVTLVIKSTGAAISMETRRTGIDTKAAETETLAYTLDGAETTATGPNDTTIKSKAHWDGAKLVLETERTVRGASITTLDVHSLDPSLKVLTIVKTLTVQHGYQFEGSKSFGTGTDVFVRAAPPVR